MKPPTELDLTIIYTDAENGWTTANVPALPGTISAGSTRDKARENVLDALRMMLSTPPEHSQPGDHVELLRVRLQVARSRGHSRER